MISSRGKQMVFKNSILFTRENIFENIRGHDFFRGVELNIDLANLAQAYSASSIMDRFICFVICELCETGQYKWVDFDVEDVSAQFRNQWHNKITGGGDTGQYIHSWNTDTNISYDRFTEKTGHQFGISTIIPYREWMFGQLVGEFGDVKFTFRVMIDTQED